MSLYDYGLGTLAQYGLTADRSARTRGALLCYTAQGLLILWDFNCSKKHLANQREILMMLQENGINTDYVLRNDHDDDVMLLLLSVSVVFIHVFGQGSVRWVMRRCPEAMPEAAAHETGASWNPLDRRAATTTRHAVNLVQRRDGGCGSVFTFWFLVQCPEFLYFTAFR